MQSESKINNHYLGNGAEHVFTGMLYRAGYDVLKMPVDRFGIDLVAINPRAELQDKARFSRFYFQVKSANARPEGTDENGRKQYTATFKIKKDNIEAIEGHPDRAFAFMIYNPSQSVALTHAKEVPAIFFWIDGTYISEIGRKHLFKNGKNGTEDLEVEIKADRGDGKSHWYITIVDEISGKAGNKNLYLGTIEEGSKHYSLEGFFEQFNAVESQKG